MTKVQWHEILLALLTALVNNVAIIPRLARFALFTNNFRCRPEPLLASVRGHSPMPLPTKTINIFCAALFAVVCFATASFAEEPSDTDAQNWQDRSDPRLQADNEKNFRWMIPAHQRKRSPIREEFPTIAGSGNSRVPLAEGEQYRKQVDPDNLTIPTVALGRILPDGRYTWTSGGYTRVGVVPNPTLAMPGFDSPWDVKDSNMVQTIKPFISAIDPTMAKRTTSITNWEFAAIMGARTQMLSEMRQDPTRWKDAMREAQEGKQAATAQNQAQMSEADDKTAFKYCAYIPLINVANERAWVKCDADAPFKGYENAAWMVGQMYKQVYIPMAILFLLPGAVCTQLKVIVRTGFLFGGNDEDTVSPFSGVMRAMIAVFLIPATQLFVSYTIDVGNSLTWEVVNFKPYFDLDRIHKWKGEQTYDPKSNHNHVQDWKDGAHQEKARTDLEKKTYTEQQHYVGAMATQWYNTLNSLLSQGMVCLNAFQFVMIMYLFLLGPIAAALFAWPGVAGEAFKKVFANWMNGVVLCTLWKFWWCVILLAMSVRLYMMDAGPGLPPANDPFEMFMCAAFSTMLMYIPFNPFDFRPGEMVSSVLEKAQQQVSKGGGGASAVGSAGAAGGGGGSGGGQNAGISGGMGG